MKFNEILNNIVSAPHSAFFFTPPLYKNSKSYIFSNPDTILTVNNPGEIEQALNEVQDFISRGYSGFAALSYELGYFLEPRLHCLFPSGSSSELMIFYLFKPENVTVINSKDIDYSSGKSNNYSYNFSDLTLNVNHTDYINNIKKIKQYIAEGETYQVNYTIKARFRFDGDIPGFFLQGIYNQSARYSALLNLGNKYVISFSPELFFSVQNRNLISVPMKGTIARGKNLQEDRNNFREFQNSKKNRAENLMITDLLRNDMGRISTFGSVKLKKLFHIEKYETLFQMVSVISSKLRENTSLKDIILNLFPGGSITGAPKIRTMKIIRELEKEPRGIYTGALGMFTRNTAVFNIPIRTIVIDKTTGKGEMGIGSGIVWDSEPEKEYEETLLKSRFLFNAQEEFEIFETMLIENGAIYLMDLHLKRMKYAADYFLFSFNKREIIDHLSGICAGLDLSKKYRLKLSLGKWGGISTALSELQEDHHSFKVVISEKRIDSQCKYYYFKTTHRELYTNELKRYRQNGFDEVLFMNENDEVCEGSFTNVFIRKKNIWYTPPVSCGLLNGTYRQLLLKNRKLYKEKIIYLSDLQSADEIKLVNSLRKEILVESVCWNVHSPAL